MGKERNQAASVAWSELTAAIAANPQRSSSLSTGTAASSSITAMPADEPLNWLPGWTEDTTCTINDIVSFVLWISDPMYRVGAPSVRYAMEKEEASTLLHCSESMWKEKNGRVRGWVRKHLEEDLRLRAGGGDPAPDAWESCRTQRRAALLIDYICTVRGLRLALWWPEHKTVTVVGVGAEVIGINCTSGRLLMSQSGWCVPAPLWPALLMSAKDMTWQPCVAGPSIGATTIAQIQEALVAIQPTAIKTGGRAVLWTRLQWARLERSLKGLSDPTESDGLHSSVALSP